MATIRYAKGPVTYLFDRETRTRKAKQLLWGDWVRVGADLDADWSEVTWGRAKLAVRKADLQDERLCEMIFLDVGQGDGCILTTPVGDAGKERILIIDAGDGDNMERYLNWRFRDFRTAFRFHAAVITHSDRDHYQGFADVFANPNVSFDVVYHNGIMERAGPAAGLLGPRAGGFLTDLRPTRASVAALYADPAVSGGKLYASLMLSAVGDPARFGDVRMLSTEHGAKEGGRTYVPGFAPSDSADFTIEVLGPVVEPDANGNPRLRTFGPKPDSSSMDAGKTKNGHSVLLKLRYRDFSVVFGGDLNLPAETFLLRHYGNGGQAPTSHAETAAMVASARTRLDADVLKCCHHGSSDVTDEFLAAVTPVAYVVSSGDEESHVHPRPDLLGRLGRNGRAPAPLILCTEILRSTREREDPKLRRALKRLDAKVAAAADPQSKAAAEKEREDLLDDIFKRNVGVYGAINLRTDGKKAVVAFRAEKGSDTDRWFVYELERDASGEFHAFHR